MFDREATIQPEEFYTQEFFCEVETGGDCDGCGVCFDNEAEDTGTLAEAMSEEA
jgi:hypothetical protein